MINNQVCITKQNNDPLSEQPDLLIINDNLFFTIINSSLETFQNNKDYLFVCFLYVLF